MLDMEPIEEIADRLDAHRAEAAEQMTPGERILAGPALFDIGVMMMRAGIRMDHPQADDQEVEQMVVERLREARRLEAIL